MNGLPPEVVAVAFAKCSRSQEPFDEIAAELNEDKSRQFHEKWVVGYGHGSVAEHAVLSLAIENVSILATKVIEDNRLASYTEKSTRYQQFDKTRYYVPALREDLRELYRATMDGIMDAYTAMVPAMKTFVQRKYPEAGPVEQRNRCFDNLRNILPVSVLTNLGMTINARNLEHAIVKLLSHPLEEMNEIGEGLKTAALEHTPTLIKYTAVNAYMQETDKLLEPLGLREENMAEAVPVRLVEYDTDAVEKICAGLLYKYSAAGYETIRERVAGMDAAAKAEVIRTALAKMGPHDAPVREFEHTYYTFDILVDYGAFRDIQRHRMMTQTNQDFHPYYGYDVPEEVTEAGLEADYAGQLERAREVYEAIAAVDASRARYILPMAYKKRVLFKANLRELYHFIPLRSSEKGHINYRRIARDMYEQVKKVHPVLVESMRMGLTVA